MRLPIGTINYGLTYNLQLDNENTGSLYYNFTSETCSDSSVPRQHEPRIFAAKGHFSPTSREVILHVKESSPLKDLISFF